MCLDQARVLVVVGNPDLQELDCSDQRGVLEVYHRKEALVVVVFCSMTELEVRSPPIFSQHYLPQAPPKAHIAFHILLICSKEQ